MRRHTVYRVLKTDTSGGRYQGDTRRVAVDGGIMAERRIGLSEIVGAARINPPAKPG